MSQLIGKWTAMITETSTGLTVLLSAIALLALAAVVILAVVTHDDKERAAKVKTIITILAFLGVFSVGGALVTWAMA